MKLEKGISVIIPTYKGEKYISKLLDTLINQTMDFNLFEVILIVNGPKDNTESIIEKYIKENPEVNIILTESNKGVSNARNKGIKLAKRQYTIFIDDDDYISHNYLETLYKYASENRIVLGSFFDVDEDSGEISESYLTAPLLKYSGIIENPFNDEMTGALVITQNKLIPTLNVKNSSFNPELKNGVDVSYYSKFYAENDFEIYIVDKSKEAIYYRLWRDNSISRQKLSYEFNVKDRLKVINDINKGLEISKNQEIYNFIKTLTAGQVVMINKYLKENPSDYQKVLKDICSYNFKFFPYKYLNEDIKKLNNNKRELIISYAFSPTNTTTSNVVAKRILTEKQNVDVVCASLNDLNKDHLLEKIVDEYVVNKYIIESDFSTEWDNIKNFTKKALEILPKYDKIYSRAFFSHSHFLALEYKLKYPKTYWRAEFSDPLVKPLGKRTSSEIDDEEYVNRINSILKEKNLKLINVNQDVNLICEYLTFIFADEIIFTNENQKKVMISNLPSNIKINDTISPHPTLDDKYYYITDYDYKIDKNYLNFAYFGNIFSKRSFEDFISAFLNIKNKDNLRIHIFTKSKTLFEQVLPKEIYDISILNNEVNYLEFLNLTKKFDVLLVEDSYTKDDEIINPYLPSKISDYKGSKTSIWAVCEDSSPTDKLDLKYKSKLNDYNSNIQTLNKIIMDKTNLDLGDEIINENAYQRMRINQLTDKLSELIEIANREFKKDEEYEAQITQLNQNLKNLKKEHEIILNSNSWKLTSNFRKIGKKFK